MKVYVVYETFGYPCVHRVFSIESKAYEWIGRHQNDDRGPRESANFEVKELEVDEK